MTTYRNPWYKPNSKEYGPEFYTTNAKPVEYRGYLIYQRIKGTVWDCVKDNVCQTQAAGINGAKRLIDNLIKNA